MQSQIPLKAFAVAGVAYRPANVIDPLKSGQEIRLVREPDNPYDANAIKVEAHVTYEPDEKENYRVTDSWEHIGYVPKKDTWLFHLMRQLGIKVYLLLSVNHAVTDQDKLLVNATVNGETGAEFI